jgi:restriction endonuclease S subunit
MTDRSHSLPDGWRWVRLGGVCEINAPRPDLARKDDSLTTFVPMSAVDERLGTIMRAERKPFGEVRKGYTYFEDGDVLFAKITPCMQNGKHAIARDLAGGFGFGTTEFHVLRPGPTIIPEWVHFFIRQPEVLENATAHFTGAVGQQRVPETYLADLDIPLPPLDEQKRIVTILNEQIGAVERARAAAEAQLDAAKALPAAYLCAVFSSPEAQQWPMKSLGEICRDISDGTHFTPMYVSSGIPFLSVKDVKETGLSFNDCRYISEEQHRELIRRCNPERGDVLYTKVGTTGIAKAIETDREFSIFVSVALLKLTETVLPEFLEKALNSPLGRTQAANLTQGMANRNLVIQDLKRIRVPTPPLPDQERSAAMLNERMASAERTRKAIEEELDDINKLPAALLRRAFSGAL